MSSENGKLCFVVQWLEPLGTIPRKFLLTFYPADNSVAMFDVSKKRFFLSRTVCSTITQPNLFIGNTINVLSRQLKIIDYGDRSTKNILEIVIERCLIVLKPRLFQHLGRFLDKLFQLDIEVKNLRMQMFDKDSVEYLLKWSPKSKELAEVLLECAVICIELSGVKTNQWRIIDDEIEGFSSDVHCTEEKSLLANELSLIFSRNKRLGLSTATFKECSCCVIKPHAVNSGCSGKIIEALFNAGFSINAIELFHLTTKEADELFEVYRGVISNYESYLGELASGPCLAMEVKGPCMDTVVQDLRQLAGPSDPSIAKALRPTSLRALYGIDQARNALHCSDLPEDGVLEVEYFFKFLVLKGQAFTST